jgi:hypothetical protein
VSTRVPGGFEGSVAPAEFFLDGPPSGADGVLPRTIGKVHREAARTARLRLAGLITAVMLVLVSAIGLGFVVGHRVDGGPGQAQHAGMFRATDAGSGAHLAAQVSAGGSGSVLQVAVTGLPAGTICRLTVHGVDGSRVDAGGWRSGPAADPLTLSAYLGPAQVSGVEVSTATGLDLMATGP